MFPQARDQAIVAASLACIVALAWLYLLRMESPMPAMGGMAGMGSAAKVTTSGAWAFSGVTDVLLAGTMWIVMMAGMMLPSAAPMIMLVALGERRRGSAPLRLTLLFALGYLLIWTGFALAALGLQWLLSRSGLLTPELRVASGILGGTVFILAGAYEWSPLKERCLVACQSPFGFIARHWRPGAMGALRMGLAHGIYCLACCWALMLLLFVVGVMNLIWVAALAGLVLVQKLFRGPKMVSRLTGLSMLAAGAALIASALV